MERQRNTTGTPCKHGSLKRYDPRVAVSHNDPEIRSTSSKKKTVCTTTKSMRLQNLRKISSFQHRLLPTFRKTAATSTVGDQDDEQEWAGEQGRLD